MKLELKDIQAINKEAENHGNRTTKSKIKFFFD